jgi:hypothetical protein
VKAFLEGSPGFEAESSWSLAGVSKQVASLMSGDEIKSRVAASISTMWHMLGPKEIHDQIKQYYVNLREYRELVGRLRGLSRVTQEGLRLEKVPEEKAEHLREFDEETDNLEVRLQEACSALGVYEDQVYSCEWLEKMASWSTEKQAEYQNRLRDERDLLEKCRSTLCR